MKMINQFIWAFNFGFASTLIFHQGGLLLLWSIGMVPSFPWDMTPVAPYDVPKVFSLAFFGGLWGLPAYTLALKWAQGLKFWLSQIIFGAIFPTTVAMLVVFPLKGLETSFKTWVGGLILNGLWGLGVALGLYYLLNRKKMILRV